jgi:ATP-dependent protease HslVU (ClpYQ) peptidase subunit
MTLIIVDKREQPINIYYDGVVCNGNHITLRHDRKVMELTNFWYGFSGSTIYDVLFDFIDLYITKKKINITRLSLYESIVAAQKTLDFDYKDDNDNPMNILEGFLITKETQEHYDIEMQNNKIFKMSTNREPYYAYGMRQEALHLLDAGVSIEKTFEICSKRCIVVGSEYKTITLPILKESV